VSANGRCLPQGGALFLAAGCRQPCPTVLTLTGVVCMAAALQNRVVTTTQVTPEGVVVAPAGAPLAVSPVAAPDSLAPNGLPQVPLKGS
jgi:hypothetical protein